MYLRSPGGSISEVRRLRTRSHTFLASRREPLAGSGVLGVIMAEQVSRPLAPRPLSPHGCGRGQCVGGYGTRPRARAALWPEGGAPMIAMMHLAHFELFANLQPLLSGVGG